MIWLAAYVLTGLAIGCAVYWQGKQYTKLPDRGFAGFCAVCWPLVLAVVVFGWACWGVTKTAQVVGAGIAFLMGDA